MTDELKRFWDDIAPTLRRAKGLAPLTPEEADALLKSASEEAFSEDDIDRVVDAVKTGEFASPRPFVNLEWTDNADTHQIEEDMLVLNRNAGDSDSETDELLNRLRKEALQDDESDQDENTERGA